MTNLDTDCDVRRIYSHTHSFTHHTQTHTHTHTEVLREGDELLEVNGIPVIGRSTDEIVRLMVSQ